MNRQSNSPNLNKIRIALDEEFSKIIGEKKEFPKYTTQLINIANQNAGGTKPKIVGKMTDLIQQCPDKTYVGWRKWYLEQYPDAIDVAAKKVSQMVKNMDEAMDHIDYQMVRDWVEDLVINKTAEGLVIQEIILKHLSNISKEEWRTATSEEESKNIDGYIGNIPIQIKPITYLSKKTSVREKINIEVIYYKRTDKYLYLYLEDGSKFRENTIQEFLF